MRIAFLLRPSSQAGAPPGTPHVPPVTEQIITYLRDLGVQIDLVVAEGKAWDVAELAAARPEHDLYVLKTAPPLVQDQGTSWALVRWGS